MWFVFDFSDFWLFEGIIKGCGLDVCEVEPLPSSSPLWSMENVLITPHVAGAMADYWKDAIRIFCDHLRCFVSGKPLPFEIDKSLYKPVPTK